MKNILLPTDFSHNASNAVKYIREMYQKEECMFTFLHAYKVNDYEEGSLLTPVPRPGLMEAAQREKSARLQKLIENIQLEEPNPNHTFEYEIANKPLVKAVEEQLNKKDIQLIAIGTQGHTGADQVVYGSNTVNLMEDIQNCPIIAIPANVVFKGLSEIVLANSYEMELNPKDLHFLTNVSKQFNAPLRVLHITEEGGLTEKQVQHKKILKERLEKEKGEFSFHSLDFLSIPLGIYSFTESRGSDLVAFINKKHGFIENLLFDPLYKNLAHFSKIPVLVLHQP